MRILLIGNPTSYENQKIAKEFQNSGADFTAISKDNLLFKISNNEVIFTTVNNDDLTTYDTYMFRGMGDNMPERMVLSEYLYSLGKIIIEDKYATDRLIFTKFNTKLTRAGIPTIDTELVSSVEYASKVKYPVIVKTRSGSRGRSVFKAKNASVLRNLIEEYSTVIIQPYLPIKYDYRVFIVGEKILGVMKRYNTSQNFLTNISAGGRAESSTLPEDVLNTCLKAASVLKTEIAGVDVLEHEGKYYILEVNNSPQFRGFESCTKVNVAKEIVEYVLKKSKLI